MLFWKPVKGNSSASTRTFEKALDGIMPAVVVVILHTGLQRLEIGVITLSGRRERMRPVLRAGNSSMFRGKHPCPLPSREAQQLDHHHRLCQCYIEDFQPVLMFSRTSLIFYMKYGELRVPGTKHFVEAM